MSFSREKHLAARAVELVMEISAIEHEARAIDERGDEIRRSRWGWLTHLGAWISSIVEEVPGGRKARDLFVRVVETLRHEDKLDELEDAQRDRVIAVATELAGVLEAAQ